MRGAAAQAFPIPTAGCLPTLAARRRRAGAVGAASTQSCSVCFPSPINAYYSCRRRARRLTQPALGIRTCRRFGRSGCATSAFRRSECHCSGRDHAWPRRASGKQVEPGLRAGPSASNDWPAVGASIEPGQDPRRIKNGFSCLYFGQRRDNREALYEFLRVFIFASSLRARLVHTRPPQCRAKTPALI